MANLPDTLRPRPLPITSPETMRPFAKVVSAILTLAKSAREFDEFHERATYRQCPDGEERLLLPGKPERALEGIADWRERVDRERPLVDLVREFEKQFADEFRGDERNEDWAHDVISLEIGVLLDSYPFAPANLEVFLPGVVAELLEGEWSCIGIRMACHLMRRTLRKTPTQADILEAVAEADNSYWLTGDWFNGVNASALDLLEAAHRA